MSELHIIESLLKNQLELTKSNNACKNACNNACNSITSTVTSTPVIAPLSIIYIDPIISTEITTTDQTEIQTVPSPSPTTIPIFPPPPIISQPLNSDAPSFIPSFLSNIIDPVNTSQPYEPLDCLAYQPYHHNEQQQASDDYLNYSTPPILSQIPLNALFRKSNSRSTYRVFVRVIERVGYSTLIPPPSDLCEYFSQFGEVTDCYLPESAANIAYLCFNEQAAVDRCLAHLNGHLICQSLIHVSRAYPRPEYTSSQTDRIFVKNIPLSITRFDLKKYFTDRYGEVLDVYIPKDKTNGSLKRFAFITFRDQSSAMMCLSSDIHIMGDGSSIQVVPAEPKPSSSIPHSQPLTFITQPPPNQLHIPIPSPHEDPSLSINAQIQLLKDQLAILAGLTPSPDSAPPTLSPPSQSDIFKTFHIDNQESALLESLFQSYTSAQTSPTSTPTPTPTQIYTPIPTEIHAQTRTSQINQQSSTRLSYPTSSPTSGSPESSPLSYLLTLLQKHQDALVQQLTPLTLSPPQDPPPTHPAIILLTGLPDPSPPSLIPTINNFFSLYGTITNTFISPGGIGQITMTDSVNAGAAVDEIKKGGGIRWGEDLVEIISVDKFDIERGGG